jgi:amino acid transporter
VQNPDHGYRDSTGGAIGTLGTFSGVFTPSILTILGIILFLRLGYVVGNAGLGRSLVIIGLANAISVLTSISLSAIATNIKVKGGGDYYLISRTLGVEFGGAIGIVLFLAQSVSIAFYCIGFGEALSGILGGYWQIPARTVAVMAVSFLFIFAWLGADWATRFQYVVMALLAAALFSFFLGGFAKWDAALFAGNWSMPEGSLGFWTLFAIFFPAVTGFTQGVSMSGDLKDAGKSLPLGTFVAVGISIVVYFGAAMVFAGAASLETLAGDYGAMKGLARYGFLIDAGVVAATLSSAMASFLGAPRILQSLSADRIFRFLLPFAEGVGPSNNPRRGVLLSTFIAFATIAGGNLNAVASVVSMFFLISYGLLNYATYFEARSASPSFRPRFRWFDKRLSLLGFIACLGAMLAINPAAGAVAISVLFAIFQYLRRTSGPSRWADSRRSYHMQQVRDHLIAAASEPEHARDWRPQLIAFSDDPMRREHLLRFASWIQGGSGLVTAVRILEGEGMKMLKAREEAQAELKSDIREHKLHAFPLVLVSPKTEVGVHSLVQAYGIGPLRANTVLLNWLEDIPRGILGLGEITYGRSLRAAFRLGCNTVILHSRKAHREKLESQPGKDRLIDVWWWGDATGRLCLLLAYLMTRSQEWEGARIRVLAPGEDELKRAGEGLEETLEEVRIDAESMVVPNADMKAMAALSADAALVFLPFHFSGNNIRGPFETKIEELSEPLPMAALVLAAEDIDLAAEPETGEVAKTAEALDRLALSREKAGEAEKAVLKAEESIEKMEKKLAEMTASAKPGLDSEKMAEIESAGREVEKAREQLKKAEKKAAKARALADDAARQAESLGAEVKDNGKKPKDEP